jgi:integrating conjugative element protein (TIGR03755 family)
MGGAEPIQKPIWSSYNPVPLQVSADLSWNYSCGKFSLSGSVNKLLQDVSTAADDYMNAMVANAQAAIASLPGIILQRANPTLYDIMQNGLLRAQASANAARLDCKAMEQTIMANGSGVGGVWDNLKEAAKLSDWKAQASYSRNDIVGAQKNVDTNAGKNGIAWVGAGGATVRAGGDNQQPIKLTGDVMGVGYEMVVRAGNPSTNAASAKSTSKSFGLFQLFNVFPTKKSAQDWITEVVGETVATTTEGGAKTTQPGYGLSEKVAQEAVRVSALLVTALAANRPLSNAEREAISPEALMSEQLLKAIRELPADDRALMMVRLSNEIAMTNIIRKALMAIAILRVGGDHPNIASSLVASENTEEIIGSVKQYIEDLLYDSRIRKELVGETATAILDRANAQRSAPVIAPERGDDQEPALGTTKRNNN